LLFAGNDWAEEHHDIEVQDQTGRVLARAKLPEGVAGIARFHVGAGHHAALRQLGNRLVGILHGCLTTNSSYDEPTAWAHHQQDPQAAA
jgi:hypothetical protein